MLTITAVLTPNRVFVDTWDVQVVADHPTRRVVVETNTTLWTGNLDTVASIVIPSLLPHANRLARDLHAGGAHGHTIKLITDHVAIFEFDYDSTGQPTYTCWGYAGCDTDQNVHAASCQNHNVDGTNPNDQ